MRYDNLYRKKVLSQKQASYKRLYIIRKLHNALLTSLEIRKFSQSVSAYILSMVFKCGYLRIMRLSSFIISAFCILIKAFFARKCHVLLKLSTPKRLLNVLCSNMNKKMVFFQCIMKKENLFLRSRYFYSITK